MEAYLEILREVYSKGQVKDDRTGVGTKSVSGMQFRHNMKDGFPLVTTKRMATKTMKVELEGFIKGITDKQWYQSRGCNIWNQWCNPKKVEYSNNNREQQVKMAEERDLGPIYGFQWRYFGADYIGHLEDYDGKGVDQLENLVNTLKSDPSSRRMVVSSWNPLDSDQMALDPCHYSWQVIVTDGKLDLVWSQRSVDTFLGLPFNIASYGTLLHLLCKETGYEEGSLIGQLGDTHLYHNHMEQVEEQLSRSPNYLPTAITDEFHSIFDWEHTQTKFKNYSPHPGIKALIAI